MRAFEFLTELDVRYNYMRDKFSPLTPIPPPISTNTAGSKSFLPSLSTSYITNSDIYDQNSGSKSAPAPAPWLSSVSEQKNTYPSPSPIPDVFNNKIIQTKPTLQTLNYNQYYYTNDRANMFTQSKNITDTYTNPTYNTNPTQIDSYPYLYNPTTAINSNLKQNINRTYEPITEQTRSRNNIM